MPTGKVRLSLMVLALLVGADPVWAGAPVQVGPGLVIVDESIVWDLDGEPGRVARELQSDLKHGDLPKVASGLKKIAAYLTLEAARGAEATKAQVHAAAESLRAEARRLVDLTDRTERALRAQESTVRQLVAQSFQALAHHHLKEASLSFSAKQSERTGRALGASLDYLQTAFEWGGLPLEQGKQRLIRGYALLADDLAQGTATLSDRVSRALENGSQELARLSDRLRQGTTPRLAE